MTRLVPVVVALLSFTGCTLIDQRTFAPSPEAKAQPAPSPPVVLDKRTPLVTIDYTIPSPDYGDLLHAAVRAAEARYPDVQYDVVVMLADTAQLSEGQQRAAAVMTAIMRDRVPAGRIHLAMRTDPALAAGQIRVYVR